MQEFAHFQPGVCSFDVEDWYHILDSAATPNLEAWATLESRIKKNVSRILEILSDSNTSATFFWLGWVAERNRKLVRTCIEEGHEVACHGYAHLLPFKVGRKCFREDIRKGKAIIEEMTAAPVYGFRAPGFGIKKDCQWAFDEIKEAGYTYDSSVFPARRGHGGIAGASVYPHLINTSCGPLAEIPISVVGMGRANISLFGGGYLRLFPLSVIRIGMRQLKREARPLVLYLHPRELDPGHKRLPLPLIRRFKTYVNLGSTEKKLRWIIRNGNWVTMGKWADIVIGEKQ